MSYSFNRVAEDKAAALEAVDEEVAKIAEQQPVHEHDRDAILSNAAATLSLLADDDSQDIYVSCNGYLSYSGSADEPIVTSASVACHASLRDRSLRGK